MPARQAVDFVRRARRPMFLEFAPYAPHAPATPPPAYEDAFARKLVPYEEPIRVPLVIRYDPLAHEQPSPDAHLVLKIDLAPPGDTALTTGAA